MKRVKISKYVEMKRIIEDEIKKKIIIGRFE